MRRLYDLKGSMLKREVFAKNKEGKKIDHCKGHIYEECQDVEHFFKNSATLKDINLLNLTSNQYILKFTQEDIDQIFKQMALDLKMLEMHNLMDYSLLFVVSFNPAYVKKFKD